MVPFRVINAPLQVDGCSGLQQAVPVAGCTPVILQNYTALSTAQG